MIRKNPRGDRPVVHPSSFVDPTAILCGLVVVEENVFIGPYAVIRADEMDKKGILNRLLSGLTPIFRMVLLFIPSPVLRSP